MFSMNVVFSSWVQACSVMVCTPGSVAQSIGPRETSTRETMKRPPFEDSFDSRRLASAQSTTVILGGGRMPARHEATRLSVRASELGSSELTELVEVLADIVSEDLDHLALLEPEI